MILIGAALTACSASRGVSSPPAEAPPQIDGKIVSIQAGSPSYVILKNVDVIGKNGGVHKSKKKVKLPSGHFVSPKHWQSKGDTLDLFIGDDFTFMTETGQMLDDAGASDFAGVVQLANSKKMIVQKILYDTKSSDSHAMKYTDQMMTIHFVPYTKVSLNGSRKSKVSNIKKGDAVLFILIGPRDHYIATQITDFHSIGAAGWDMVNGTS